MVGQGGHFQCGAGLFSGLYPKGRPERPKISAARTSD
jgi:hypothetical protein